MGFSYSKYIWRCVLGAEIAYAACVAYNTFLVAEKTALHKSLLELLPGFQWGSVSGFIFAGIWIAVYAAAVGAYITWMLNSSVTHGCHESSAGSSGSSAESSSHKKSCCH